MRRVEVILNELAVNATVQHELQSGLVA